MTGAMHGVDRKESVKKTYVKQQIGAVALYLLKNAMVNALWFINTEQVSSKTINLYGFAAD